MSVDLRTAPSASTLTAPSPSAPGAMCTASGPAAFSIASEGSPAVPRLASTWVRGTALPALAGASDEVQRALDRAADSFQGVSGTAYAFHASIMLRHLRVLADGLSRAAGLFDAYADRLAAHEALLSGVRAQAVASDFPVTGDLVGAPDGPAGVTQWTAMAAGVAAERQALREWVATHLQAAVDELVDEETFEWVGQFFATHHSTLVSGTLGTVLKQRYLTTLLDEDDLRGSRRSGNPARKATGEALIAGGELDRLEHVAGQLDHASKALGPVTFAYDTVNALGSDEPAGGMMGVLGSAGFAAGASLALPVATPVVVTGATVMLAAMAGTIVGTAAWHALPEDWQDSADEILGDAVDEVTDLAGDAVDGVKDLAGDVASGLASWVR